MRAAWARLCTTWRGRCHKRVTWFRSLVYGESERKARELRRPYSLTARGRRPFFPPRIKRGDGAPSGASLVSTPCGVGASGETRAPLGAPSRLFCPRGRSSGRRPGRLSAHPIRQTFARLRPRRVQSLKTVPRSRDGRLPEASRERGYESRPQAPHFAPSPKRLAKTPSMSKASSPARRVANFGQ